jgi:phosphoglycerate dehydrogenase-like enzyme
MIILLTRDLYPSINRKETFRINGALSPITPGLAGNNITILGAGYVGKRVAELTSAFGMNVSFFKRGDDLYKSVKNADVVVDTLSSNPTTHKLLDEKFFNSMKQNSYFVSVTRSEIVDEDALIRALDAGKLADAASDLGGILVGDTEDPLYKKLLSHPKILVTPHIAYNSEKSRRTGADIMIDNVEAWINGKPQNVVGQP